jgi:bifunctional non-homologous end joining protein LigD
MASTMSRTRWGSKHVSLPAWVKPQLAALVKQAPDGPDWLHEIKLDGYRMHARLDAGRVRILTRRGNDWTDKSDLPILVVEPVNTPWQGV